MCLFPNKVTKTPHSTNRFTCYGHLIQPNVSASNPPATSFNQAVHLLWMSHSTQCACLKTNTPPHSTKRFTCYGRLIQADTSFKCHASQGWWQIHINSFIHPFATFSDSYMRESMTSLHLLEFRNAYSSMRNNIRLKFFFCSTVFLCLKLALPPSLSHNYHLPPPSQSCSSPLSHPITLAVPKPTTTAVKRSSNPQRSALRSCEVKVSEPWL